MGRTPEEPPHHAEQPDEDPIEAGGGSGGGVGGPGGGEDGSLDFDAHQQRELERPLPSYNAPEFGAVWESIRPKVFASALRRNKGDEEAAEADTHEACVQFWQRWRRGLRPRKPIHYARTILRNIVGQRARRASKVGMVGLPDEAEPLGRELRPDEVLDNTEQGHLVREAVQRLGEQFREVIELTYFAGLTNTEAAAVLGRPEGTVHWQKKKGIARLHELLRELLGEA